MANSLVGSYTSPTAAAVVPAIDSSSMFISNPLGAGGLAFGSEVIRKVDMSVSPALVSYLNPATGVVLAITASDVSGVMMSRSIGKIEIASLVTPTKLYTVLTDIPTGTKTAVVQVKGGTVSHLTISDLTLIPTTAIGYLTSDGGSFVLESMEDIKNFRAISANGGKLYCEFRS